MCLVFIIFEIKIITCYLTLVFFLMVHSLPRWRCSCYLWEENGTIWGPVNDDYCIWTDTRTRDTCQVSYPLEPADEHWFDHEPDQWRVFNLIGS